mmetsp:Transcript_7515/g.19724  ORF Transcript_7515/g.19724 Transcript_7515/m.19724 type:complete len:252 (+) Transcript_7515:1052-1807(+)
MPTTAEMLSHIGQGKLYADYSAPSVYFLGKYELAWVTMGIFQRKYAPWVPPCAAAASEGSMGRYGNVPVAFKHKADDWAPGFVLSEYLTSDACVCIDQSFCGYTAEADDGWSMYDCDQGRRLAIDTPQPSPAPDAGGAGGGTGGGTGGGAGGDAADGGAAGEASGLTIEAFADIMNGVGAAPPAAACEQPVIAIANSEDGRRELGTATNILDGDADVEHGRSLRGSGTALRGCARYRTCATRTRRAPPRRP